MPVDRRLDQIIELVNERGFASVNELSQLCQVSEMTIRRDLELLASQQRIQRTYGGAVSLQSGRGASGDLATVGKSEDWLFDRVDVLVAAAVNPKYDSLLIQRAGKNQIPVVAESLAIQDARTVIAVDNYQAAYELGLWAGQYALSHWSGRTQVLDLTYHLSNTQARSRGFIAGMRAALPSAVDILSLNAESRYDTAYQLTRDALTVHPAINIIFAINDILAWGALNACQDLKINPNDLLILPFGLEGNTMRNAVQAGGYCKAGLAMFPEIVAPTCVDAAIAAFNDLPIQAQLITPYCVLTSQSLTDYYRLQQGDWEFRPEAAAQLNTTTLTPLAARQPDIRMPRRIGFVVPFMEHEWYRSLAAVMNRYAKTLQIEIEIVDVEKNLEDEIDLRRREIAVCAAQLVQPGEVILIDGGPIANLLAEELLHRNSLTIITNSVQVFDILRQNPDNILISTGGAYRSTSQMLVGPTAEGALRELRADKLFLMVPGISFSFGLSHTNISEVTVKQTMIRSAREVILLADHFVFGQESTIQVAPLTVVHKLVTDDALPASIRLELSRLGLHIILAGS